MSSDDAGVNCADIANAPAILLTPRVRLETACVSHAAAFCEGVQASVSALIYVAWSLRLNDFAWAHRFCESDARSAAAGEDLAFHAFEIESDAWVGRIDVHTIDFDARRGEIGYVGDLRRAGRGLMREAVCAVIDLCFRLGFERVEAMSDVRNDRALHFAEILGMTREGVLRHHELDLQGKPCNMALYAVLRPAA